MENTNTNRFGWLNLAQLAFAALRRAKLAMLVVALLTAYLLNPFYQVPTGSRGVVTQFGKIIGIEGEGLTILPPWQTLDYFSVRAQTVNLDEAEGSTSDTQPVKTSLTIRYNNRPEKVADIFERYSHKGDLNDYLKTAAQETFKAVTAKYTAPDLINLRAKVSQDISDTLQKKVDIYGAQVVNIDMRQFSFSPEYMKAINDKVTQEQLRLGAENKLKTVEAIEKQKVVVATADANAAKAKADGEAYSNLTVAKAQAESLEIQSSALARSKDVLELRRIEVEKIKAERWNGLLPQHIYAGAPIPFMNMQSKP
jgi:prohibitin 2